MDFSVILGKLLVPIQMIGSEKRQENRPRVLDARIATHVSSGDVSKDSQCDIRATAHVSSVGINLSRASHVDAIKMLTKYVQTCKVPSAMLKMTWS